MTDADEDQLPEADRRLLAIRAERERRRILDEVEPEGIWVAVLRMRDEEFGLPLASLGAVVPIHQITPVPLAHAAVLGVLRYGDDLVTALSTALLVGDRAWGADPNVLLLVDVAGGSRVAVDCVGIPSNKLVASSAIAAGVETSPGIRELLLPGEPALKLLDLRSLLHARGLGS